MFSFTIHGTASTVNELELNIKKRASKSFVGLGQSNLWQNKWLIKDATKMAGLLK